MKHILTTFAAFAVATSCLAWGKKGHDTTCAIAQQHITENAKQHIAYLLDGKSIVYWCNWLDDASNTPDYAYSKTWHYKNVDAGQNYDDVAPFPTGDVVTALTEQIQNIRDCEAKLSLANADALGLKESEALSLKMVVHLMGDLHQPMHMGHASDLGGNLVKLSYFKTETNLHSVWDTSLLEGIHAWSHTEWVEEIDRLSSAEMEAIQVGTLDDWARETASITAKIYDDSPEGAQLSYDYVRVWGPTIEQQLERGGLRLAKVLNSLWP